VRGRKPKPVHLRLLEGNRGKRGASKEIREEVKGVLSTGKRTANPGKPPVWLTAGAKMTWNRIVREKGLVWLDSSDREIFAAFCVAFARVAEAEKAIKLHGLTYETVGGGVGMRPEVRIVNQCSALIRSLGSELGLSPAARVRLGTVKKDPKTASDLPPELGVGTPNTAGA
jgi:P27 family predicted phage terminase small subunit